MKKIVCLALLVSSFCFAQKYTIVQINAEWNDKNTLQLPKVIEGANVVFGYLENQNESLKSQIKAVPVVLVYKDDDPIGQFTAGLDFKLNIGVDDIKKLIQKSKQ